MYILPTIMIFCVATKAATQLDPRGIPFRPDYDPDSEPPPPKPYDPETPQPADPDIISSEPGEQGETPTAPEYEPAPEANECLEEECDEVEEVAKEVMSKLESLLVSVIANAAATSSSSVPVPTISGLSFSSSTPAFSTAYTTQTAVPNYNVAAGIELTQEQYALLDSNEQDMYRSDPLCFFANVERKYASAASVSSSPALSSAIARRNGDFLSLDTSLVPLDSAFATSYQTDFFESYMPSAVLTIYAPVRGSASVSMTTVMTTCSSLDTSGSFITPYAVRLARSTSVAATSSAVPSGEVKGAGVQHTATLASVVGAAGLVAFLAVL